MRAEKEGAGEERSVFVLRCLEWRGKEMDPERKMR